MAAAFLTRATIFADILIGAGDSHCDGRHGPLTVSSTRSLRRRAHGTFFIADRGDLPKDASQPPRPCRGHLCDRGDPATVRERCEAARFLRPSKGRMTEWLSGGRGTSR